MQFEPLTCTQPLKEPRQQIRHIHTTKYHRKPTYLSAICHGQKQKGNYDIYPQLSDFLLKALSVSDNINAKYVTTNLSHKIRNLSPDFGCARESLPDKVLVCTE